MRIYDQVHQYHTFIFLPLAKTPGLVPPSFEFRLLVTVHNTEICSRAPCYYIQPIIPGRRKHSNVLQIILNYNFNNILQYFDMFIIEW